MRAHDEGPSRPSCRDFPSRDAATSPGGRLSPFLFVEQGTRAVELRLCSDRELLNSERCLKSSEIRATHHERRGGLAERDRGARSRSSESGVTRPRQYHMARRGIVGRSADLGAAEWAPGSIRCPKWSPAVGGTGATARISPPGSACRWSVTSVDRAAPGAVLAGTPPQSPTARAARYRAHPVPATTP